MTAYYNEHDPYAASWLRNLIAAGHIAPGDVDERDVRSIRPWDLDGYTQCHFFAGIGVWSHALRLAGWGDDRPVWTASIPCQPLSSAGLGLGHVDERHLWPAFHDLLAERAPAVLFGEQVASADGREWFAAVRSDLEHLGYACGGADLAAAGIGAPHKRNRIFFVAHAASERRDRPELAGAAGAPAGGSAEARGRRSPGAVEPAGLRATGVLADAAISRPQGGGSRRGARSRDEGAAAERGGAAGGMDNAVGNRRRASRDDHAEHERVVADAAEPACGLGDADAQGQHERAERDGKSQAWCEVQRGADALRSGSRNGGVADAHGGNAAPGRSERGGQHGFEPHDGGSGFWSDVEWIACRDGKARPTKPGLFPLAHGASDRVGKLRAAGNAIVGPLAAEFIRASIEALNLPVPASPSTFRPLEAAE